MDPISDELKYTPREIQIARLLAAGESTKRIASILGIAYRTVINHRQAVVKRAKCKNSTEAVAKMVKQGVI